MRRDLPPRRFGEARARLFLSPREAEEEARELDAVIERRGREVLAAQLFVERRGDGVHEPDQARGDRYPRVADGVHDLMTPSRQQFVRRRDDVAVSVTSWDDALRRRSDLHGLVHTAHPGAPPDRVPRRQHRSALVARQLAGSACAVQNLCRRRDDSHIYRSSRPLRSLGVEQTKGWQARRPLKGGNRHAKEAHDGRRHQALHYWLLRC